MLNYNIKAGKFGKIHGIKGLVKFFSYLDIIDETLIKDKKITLIDENNAEYELCLAFVKDNCFICKVNDTADCNISEALCNKMLYIAREKLGTDIITFDVINFEVYNSVENNKIGYVKDSVNYGSGELLEILTLNDKEILCEFTKECISNIDLDNKRIYLTLVHE